MYYQVDGHSGVNQYRRVLSRGCRCVELDVWDGDDGEPVIYHGIGVQLSSKILFKDVLAAINESAFVENDQLVILSLENHASASQQVRMAELIRSMFHERLFREPLWQGDTVFPSLDQLRGRIIIQGEPPAGKSEDDGSDDEIPAGVEVSESAQQIHENKKASAGAICDALADCVSFYQAAPFRGFEQSSDKISFLNMSESSIGKWDREGGGVALVRFDTLKLSRIYPAWWRVLSTNYDPITHWMHGCQVRMN